ncbi:NADP-dependent oxidoreductase [Phytomonospora endophytica]|uniref:NADPH:quinone reductase-like Zn-dependent oxidoreductase n=1 Tax=Phytomonospora endophytica TaxID=714109 RepID=A0A841FQ24_9ACTN|nr:NADP-dependent oxidoreductase [Phytomonospora endophytica]MBB6035898.1 NADPH:quinone reductase-like Zn-dependent oxidoreductase [Phytomonospora endophytica]GIG71106.1 NADPH:quinone reductase [Phytomonospora endophytica]
MAKMRAVMPGPGGLAVAEVERPEAGRVEVLVRVHAASVNPADVKLVANGRSTGAPPEIPGFDVSGVVEAVGEGVRLFQPGDEVFGMIRFPHPGRAYAEYATTPTRHLALKPASIDHVQAAALPLASLTARQALVDTAGVRPGQRVLIHAAAGGVGHLAVQLAKRLGAYVIGTASAPKHEFLRSLGADEVVDYTAVDFTEAVKDLDVVIDPIGGDYAERSLSVLKDGGVLVDILPPGSPSLVERAAARGIAAGFMLVEPDHADMRAIARHADEGLRAEIDTVVPLAEAQRAHDRVATGRARGKVVITVP